MKKNLFKTLFLTVAIVIAAVSLSFCVSATCAKAANEQITDFTVVNYSYTVSYDANGGQDAPEAQTKYRNQDLTLSSEEPTRNCYTFLGWSKSSTATVAEYKPGGIYANNSEVTLYAVWKASTYEISYNANGGTGAPEPQTKIANQTLVLSSTVPTRDGYTFIGWATNGVQMETKAAYAAGGNYTENLPQTFYAMWSNNAKNYFVKYDPNGGECTTAAVAVLKDTNVYTLPTAEFRNNIFIGWYTEKTGGKRFEITTPVTSNMTLYARWVSRDAINVSLNVSKDSITMFAEDSATIECDYTISGTNEYIPVRTWAISDYNMIADGKSVFLHDNYRQLQISGYSEGECTISFILSEADTGFVLGTKTINVKVTKKPLTMDIASAVMNYKDSMTLNAESGYDITWTSSDTNVATVDKYGHVYGCGKGTAEITATVTVEDGRSYSKTCEIEVEYTWWQVFIRIFLLGFLWY